MKAIVLGGTIPHIDLITKLKKRGFYVILVDYTENPPAKSYADIHIQESTLDAGKVVEIARLYSVDLVISGAIDQANCIACYAGEKLGFPVPYSYQTALNVTNKARMKRVFRENNIPTADFYVIDHDDGTPPKIDYPFVIKPIDANSSKGVFKISSEQEFHAKIQHSLAISREHKAVIEQFIPGTEFEAVCIAIDGVSHILMTRDYEPLPLEGIELQNISLSMPGKVCVQARPEIEAACQKVCDAFGLVNTPFFIQAKHNSSGIYLMEFAPRIAGGSTFEVVEFYTGFDYMEALIKSFLHEPITLKVKPDPNLYKARFLYMKPGIFGRVQGVDECISSGLITKYTPYCISGREISSSFNTGNRIGSMLVSGKTYSELDSKIAEVLKRVRVIDIEGRDMTYDFAV
ncbi:MAG: ATP-grasp domain-containing protein [Synergistaceae bacterium]|nr:ATP-grasp domain-containing protein [Synergistaceae bacterium]